MHCKPTRPRPPCRHVRIILCGRSCRHPALLVVDRPEQCCGVCLPTLTDRIGIMFACLDDRLHRPRSGAQHADAPAVDFPALCGAKDFPVAAGGAPRNSVSHSRRAERSGRRPLGATAKSRRGGKVGNPPEAAKRFAVSYPGCSAVGNWQDASGNCGNGSAGSAATVDTGERWPTFRRPVFFSQSFQGLRISAQPSSG